MAISTDPTAPGTIYDRGMQLFITQTVFLVIAFIFVALRAFTKVFLVKKVTSDDWLMFASMVTYIAYSVIALQGVIGGGTGKPVLEITPEKAYVSLRAWYLCEVLYPPLTILIRTSICVFLLRIFPEKRYRYIIYGNLVVIYIISIVFFFVMALQCSPASYFWEQVFGAKGKCLNKDLVPTTTIVHSIVAAICDWVLGLLPVVLMWRVQINIRTKITICVLLGMSLVAGIALIIRIPFVRHLAISTEFLYETIDIAIFTVLEPSLGIIAGCLPTLRPLFRSLGFTTTSKNSSNPSKEKPSVSGQSGSEYGSVSISSNKRKSAVGKANAKNDSAFYNEDTITGSEEELFKGTNANSQRVSDWDIDVEMGELPDSKRSHVPDSSINIETRISITSELEEMNSNKKNPERRV